MDEALDYYQILHVHPSAPSEIIKASYRTLMQRLKAHPDLGGDHGRAAIINHAYETLMDDDLRAQYDRTRRSEVETSKVEGRSSSRRRSARRAASKALACPFCGEPHDEGHSLDKGSPMLGGASCKACSAPLSKPQEGHSAQLGERSLERLNRRQAVTLWRHVEGVSLGKPVAAVTRDISLLGMLIETSSKFEFGMVIRIECEVCRAVGRVAHVHSEGSLTVVGFEFLTVEFTRTKGGFISAHA